MHIFFLTFCLAGGGGSTAGNGGDVLVCGHNQVTFFDIFEAEKGRGLILNLGDKDLDPYTKVTKVINRIPYELLDWRNLLLRRLDLFKAKHIIGDFALEDVPDTGNIVTKPGCEIKQAVIQRRTDVPVDPIFYIAQDYWDKMDNDSKAALILHEIIYYDAIEQGHKDSIVTRSVNSYLMAKTLPTDSRCLFYQILQKSGQAKILGQYILSSFFTGTDAELYIDGKSSVMSDRCVFDYANVSFGSLMVKGVKFDPILQDDSSFPGEWGIVGMDIFNPRNPDRIHFKKDIEMNIGNYKVQLTGVRDSRWSGTGQWFSNLSQENPPPSVRPGFISLYTFGYVRGASVKKMELYLLGQNREIAGEVWFSIKEEPHRIQLVPSLPMSFKGREYLVKDVEIYKAVRDEGTIFNYEVTLDDGNRVKLSETIKNDSESVSN